MINIEYGELHIKVNIIPELSGQWVQKISEEKKSELISYVKDIANDALFAAFTEKAYVEKYAFENGELIWFSITSA